MPLISLWLWDCERSRCIEDGGTRKLVTVHISPLGHKDVRTIMVYTHVLDYAPHGVVSPVDAI